MGQITQWNDDNVRRIREMTYNNSDGIKACTSLMHRDEQDLSSLTDLPRIYIPYTCTVRQQGYLLHRIVATVVHIT